MFKAGALWARFEHGICCSSVGVGSFMNITTGISDDSSSLEARSVNFLLEPPFYF